MQMKRYILIQFFLLCSVALSAQIASGYYRIQNKVTKRYITVQDNTITINPYGTNVDLSALATNRNYSKIVNDPGSIIYIENNGNNYVLKGQGTETYTASGGYYLKVITKGDAYRAYVQGSGFTKYLADEPSMDFEDGWVLTTSSETRDWYIKPLNDTDNYFALTPTFTDGKYYYQTLFASFPYRIVSGDMKAYRITKVDNGMAVMEEIVGEIPAEMPILIRTTSNEASANRLDVLVSSTASKGANLLKGNYFNYSRRNRQTAYVASTMRVLGVLADGSIGFIKDNSLDYLPANKAYLPVTTDCEDNVRLVTQEEYDKIIATSIGSTGAASKVKAIYTLDGRKASGNSGKMQIIKYNDGSVVKKIVK